VLVFDSNIESGNLDRVGFVSLNEYNLFLNFDTNAKGHALWFYFAVSRTEEGRTVKFNILNCTKHVSHTRTYFQPFVFSQQDFSKNGVGWVSESVDACYMRNGIPRETSTGTESTFYTFTFSYTFKYTEDRVYFAYVKPYTVSMYHNMINEIKENLKSQAKSFKVLESDGLYKKLKELASNFKEDKVKSWKGNTVTSIKYNEEFQVETDSFIYRQETLCRVLTGLPIDVITITGHW